MTAPMTVNRSITALKCILMALEELTGRVPSRYPKSINRSIVLRLALQYGKHSHLTIDEVNTALDYSPNVLLAMVE